MNQNPKRKSDFAIIGGLFALLAGGVALWASTSRAPQPEINTEPVAPALQAPKAVDVPVKVVPKRIAWEKTYEDAMTRARKEGKPVMVDFYTDWCGACKILDKETYTQKSVIAESTRFVSVKVNAEKRPDLAKAFNVDGFPTIIILQADEKGVQLLSTVAGALPASEMEKWMRDSRGKFSGGPVAA